MNSWNRYYPLPPIQIPPTLFSLAILGSDHVIYLDLAHDLEASDLAAIFGQS